MRLIVSPHCPFCHRTLIVANAKGIHCDIDEIDLQEKPEWFLKLAPTGKVPVLTDDDKVLFESLAICEYFEDMYGTQLHPSDPWQKAVNRAWMQQAGEYLGGLFKIASASDQSEFESTQEQVVKQFQPLNQTIQGPYFNGEHFSLVDAIYAPFLTALEAVEAKTPCEILSQLSNLAQWAERLKTYQAVEQALPEDHGDNWLEKIKQKGGYLAQQLS